jgi:hypothetical protein
MIESEKGDEKRTSKLIFGKSMISIVQIPTTTKLNEIS